MAIIEEGKVAPAFTLENQDGKKVCLKDFRDKKIVVLYFYPKALTPGCTVQACGLRDNKTTYSRKGIVALGMSPDGVDLLARFTEKHDLNFDLFS